MNSAKHRLEASIRTHLAPVLRADGFMGTGRYFRQTAEGLIQVVQVQGSQYGGKFAINLAIHPVTVPDVLGGRPDPDAIKVELCEFRRRLTESGSDQWWEHEPTKESMDAAIEKAAAVYSTIGRRL